MGLQVPSEPCATSDTQLSTTGSSRLPGHLRTRAFPCMAEYFCEARSPRPSSAACSCRNLMKYRCSDCGTSSAWKLRGSFLGTVFFLITIQTGIFWGYVYYSGRALKTFQGRRDIFKIQCCHILSGTLFSFFGFILVFLTVYR